MTAVALRISPHKFSSLPAVSRTVVPSATSPSATTVNVAGSALLQRQCVGSAEQTTFGLPVRVTSRGLCLMNALSARSPANMSDIGAPTRWPPSPMHFRSAASPPSSLYPVGHVTNHVPSRLAAVTTHTFHSRRVGKTRLVEQSSPRVSEISRAQSRRIAGSKISGRVGCDYTSELLIRLRHHGSALVLYIYTVVVRLESVLYISVPDLTTNRVPNPDCDRGILTLRHEFI